MEIQSQYHRRSIVRLAGPGCGHSRESGNPSIRHSGNSERRDRAESHSCHGARDYRNREHGFFAGADLHHNADGRGHIERHELRDRQRSDSYCPDERHDHFYNHADDKLQGNSFGNRDHDGQNFRLVICLQRDNGGSNGLSYGGDVIFTRTKDAAGSVLRFKSNASAWYLVGKV